LIFDTKFLRLRFGRIYVNPTKVKLPRKLKSLLVASFMEDIDYTPYLDPNEEKSEQHPEGESNIQTQLEEEGELSYKSIVAFGER
jgi:hypothetical protein